MSMRGDSKSTQPATVPASAADASSSTTCSPYAAEGAVDARGIAPRAHDNLVNEVINSGESDVPDSRNVPEASRSPAVPHHSSRALSNERTREMEHSLFGSDDEFYVEEYDALPVSTRASPQERDDDGESHRHSDTGGTGKGTTLKRGELKPWRLPEQLINSLSHATSQHHQIPLFDANELHGLGLSARNFRAEEDFYLDAFFRHRWYNGNQKRDKNSLLAAWNAFVQNVKNFGRDVWLKKLEALRLKFEKRVPTGARYRSHCLSSEVGIPCLTWGDPCASCVDNSQRAHRDVYSLSSPWGRAHISAEMRDAIENLQSVYRRQKRVFTDGSSDQSDESRHTGERELQRQPSFGNEVPSCQRKVGTHATGRGNSSLILNRHDGSKYSPQESVDHRGNPPVVPVAVEIQGPAQPAGLHETLGNHERYLTELREDIEQENNRRHDLQSDVRRLRADREKNRSEFAFAQIESEREKHRLRDELEAARRETASLKDQFQCLVRDHKNLLGIIELAGYLRSRKRPRTDGTGGDDQHRT